MIKGIHHIGATVPNLDDAVAFYKGALGESLTRTFEVADSPFADKLMGLEGLRCKAALLGVNTSFLELFEYEHPAPPPHETMPVYGPGITHVCFQSPETDSAFEKFQKQDGVRNVSRSEKPVRLNPQRGITYFYARDVADNMFETEQWVTPPRPFPVWLAHVAFVSPDITRLTNFYSTVVMGMEQPPEIRRFNNNPQLDVVGNVDQGDLYGTWIPTPNILIEIWQYVNPATPTETVPGAFQRQGYTHICFQVDDTVAEYERMKHLGVSFLSEPLVRPQNVIVFGRDPDGNLFELLQVLDNESPFSLDRLDFGLSGK